MGNIKFINNILGKGVHIFLIATFLLSSFSIEAQNRAKTTVKILESNHVRLRLQIDPGDYLTKRVLREKTNYLRMEVEGFGRSNQVGYPELPQYQALINIPVCKGMSCRVTRKEEVTFTLDPSGSTLLPAQPSQSKGDLSGIAFEKNRQAYRQNAFWNPGEVVVERLGVMRNTTLARLVLSPFSYNPVTGEIRKATSMEIEITFDQPDTEATEKMYAKYDDPYSGNLQHMILNKRSETNHKDSHVSGPIHYVMISDPSFKTALKPLVDWKREKGFLVTEAYTNDPLVGADTTSIKAYLKGLYDNASPTLPAPTYVLFVGDVSQVPPFAGVAFTANHATDLYYCDWTGDYLPECYYGRFSGSSAEIIANQVSKTVEYEKYLMPDASFLNKMVAIAGKDASHETLWGDGQLNYITNNYFTSPFTVYSYPSNISGTSASDIISKINEGVSFANYSAHGNWDRWVDPAFTVSDVLELTNRGKYPVMMGNCCLSNKFDGSTDCLGEALLKAKEKGAVGYIGASNNTYWDEDYYFACGYKTIAVNAPYIASNLGSFDRLFHKNGESYADQYITSGQMLRAGNLAVTASGSSYIKYYWEIYHLMGDPSLMPYLGVPTPMTPIYNSILAVNSTSLNVTTGVPYSYVGVTMESSLLGATFADAAGIANIPLTGVTTNGTANIVITAQNRQPYFGTISVETPQGPYISMIATTVSDVTGNNNGMLDYHENTGISMTLKNIGVDTAKAVQAKLTTTCPYITMTDSLETYGEIIVDANVAKSNAFALKVSNNVPDGTQATFYVTITDNEGHTWNSTFAKTILAPAFEIYTIGINDSNGNNNNRLDAGESVEITITGKNIGHAQSTETTGTLTTTTRGVTLADSPFAIGTVAPEGWANATFRLTVAPNIPVQTAIILNYRLAEGGYVAEKLFTAVTGLVNENYESGDFTRFGWASGGNTPWSIVSTGQYEGLYCAKSGAISDNGKSVMQVTMEVISNDSITFYRRVSSEETFDFLRFYIDGNLKGEWSGELPWQRVSYPVESGEHIFKWEYAKDYLSGYGSDCGWIDYILFPPTKKSEPTSDQAISNVILFPNPISSKSKNPINITYFLNEDQNVTIQIFDNNGRLLNTLIENEGQLKGTNCYVLSPSMYSGGIYFVTIKTDKAFIARRLSIVK